MRRICLALLSLFVAMSLPILAQTTGFIVAEYLATQYTAPNDAPSSVVIAGKNEPGERLVVTGRTLDGKKPVAGVSLYVFHTDANGRMPTTPTTPRSGARTCLTRNVLLLATR